MARLKEVYNKTIKSALQKEFEYSNPFEVPRLLKVVINMGVGKAAQDSKKIQFAVNDLTAIAGQ
ncbi:MAG: 50S ribosomal protein L5, partial [Alphaproteobacteria bacterium]|nr:50S ribosomal protein L5 [Alphaproteobacteria bacterium]